jgi:TrmH family RNA methyltransferase
MTVITSTHNDRVKTVLRLRERRGRDRQGRFVIDGAREIGRAHASGITWVEAYVSPDLCLSSECQATRSALEAAGVEIHEVTTEVFARLSYGDRHDGLLAVAEPPRRDLAEIQLPDDPLVCVLEGIEKPGNVGAVLRSADGAGVSAVVVADPATDLFNPNAVRASLGTIFSLPVAAADSDETLRWLLEQGLTIYAARVGADRSYTDADFTVPCAIVLGSEAHGLTGTWSAPEVVPISLPMHGSADSLNVSATAAILVYEARRQRTAAAGGTNPAGEGSG